jgi:uncharacterized protein
LMDDALETFCRRWQIVELSVFGSVLRDDFRSDSDIDVLVDFEPGARHTIFDVVRMEDELTALVGRKIDLIEKRAIEASDNRLRKQAILGTARVFYHAG